MSSNLVNNNFESNNKIRNSNLEEKLVDVPRSERIYFSSETSSLRERLPVDQMRTEGRRRNVLLSSNNIRLNETTSRPSKPQPTFNPLHQNASALLFQGRSNIWNSDNDFLSVPQTSQCRRTNPIQIQAFNSVRNLAHPPELFETVTTDELPIDPTENVNFLTQPHPPVPTPNVNNSCNSPILQAITIDETYSSPQMTILGRTMKPKQLAYSLIRWSEKYFKNQPVISPLPKYFLSLAFLIFQYETLIVSIHTILKDSAHYTRRGLKHYIDPLQSSWANGHELLKPLQAIISKADVEALKVAGELLGSASTTSGTHKNMEIYLEMDDGIIFFSDRNHNYTEPFVVNIDIRPAGEEFFHSLVNHEDILRFERSLRTWIKSCRVRVEAAMSIIGKL